MYELDTPPLTRLTSAVALLRDRPGARGLAYNSARRAAVDALCELAGLPALAKELTELLNPQVPHAQPTKPYNWRMHEID